MDTLPSTYHTSCLPAQLHLVPALTGVRPCEEPCEVQPTALCWDNDIKGSNQTKKFTQSITLIYFYDISLAVYLAMYTNVSDVEHYC